MSPSQVLDEATARKVSIVVSLSKAECFGADIPWDKAKGHTLVVSPVHKNVRLLDRGPNHKAEQLLYKGTVGYYILTPPPPFHAETLKLLLRKAFYTKGRPCSLS